MEEHEVGASLEGGDVPHGNANDAGPEQRRHAVVGLQIVGVGERFAANVHLQREVGGDHVGHLNNESTGIRRHDAQTEIVAPRRDTDVLEDTLFEGRQHLRLHLKLHRVESARIAQNVILQEVIPRTHAAQTCEVEEGGTGTVGRLTAREAQAWDVIVKSHDRTGCLGQSCAVITNRPAIVDGHSVPCVEEGALEVEEVVVPEGLNEGHVASNPGGTRAEIADHARRIRAAVGNGAPAANGGHEQAVAIGSLDVEGLIAAANHQFKFTALLIFGLHANVIYLAVGRGVGDLDALLEPLLGGAICRRECRSLKVGQARIRGHVQIQIRTQNAVTQTDSRAPGSARSG